MSRRRHRAFCAALCVGLGLWAGPALAEPALWSIEQGGSKLYLFGTIHVWKGDRSWESPKIAAALDASAELWTELVDDDPATMAPLIAELGFDTAHPLSATLSKRDLARMDEAVKFLNIAGGKARLDSMRPWLAALTLSLTPMLRAGYDPAQGIDHVLEAQAKAYGKRARAFETAAMQTHLLADMSPALAMEMFHSALDDALSPTSDLDAIVAAWAAGDEAALEAGLLRSDEQKYAEFYQKLFVERNRAWAERIATRLNESRGIAFIAVGAGHLVGPDSLQTALEQRGITVVRD
jgi:uncharacterized protein YbaP (TraB family)